MLDPMTSRGVNLTFTNLHVVALKGILGAILGFDGKLKLYNTQQDLLFKEQKEPLKINQMIPENLLKLEGLGYSIIPIVEMFIRQIINRFEYLVKSAVTTLS
jgi:hypothetical protein